MSRDPCEILRDALAHFQIMQDHAERDLDDQLVLDAVCMRLSAGIEALAALDPTTRQKIFGQLWPLMWGMRNRIAHGYLLIDATIVRQTLVHDVPSIMSRVRLHLDTTQAAPTARDHASAAEAPPNEAARTDTVAIRKARADTIDRA